VPFIFSWQFFLCAPPTLVFSVPSCGGRIHSLMGFQIKSGCISIFAAGECRCIQPTNRISCRNFYNTLRVGEHESLGQANMCDVGRINDDSRVRKEMSGQKRLLTKVAHARPNKQVDTLVIPNSRLCVFSADLGDLCRLRRRLFPTSFSIHVLKPHIRVLIKKYDSIPESRAHGSEHFIDISHQQTEMYKK